MSALSPTVELGAQWPPIGIVAINPFNKGGELILYLTLTLPLVCSSANSLNPNWISGFSDAESSFMILVRKKSDFKLKWSVEAAFAISINKIDLSILKSIQDYFGVGNINFNKRDNCYTYSVKSVKDLINVIIPHFERYPLITKKQIDFFLFKSAIELINSKEHLTLLGLHKIVNIKASINNGLSKSLKETFPNWTPVPKPPVQLTEIQDANWLAGFVNGDGSFFVTIAVSKTNKIGYSVRLQFNETQHSRDLELLNSFTRYFNCGFITANDNLPVCIYTVSRFKDILNIIQFFEKYPLEGAKKKDFLDWCSIAKLMVNKEHHTNSGLAKIIQIKGGMNQRRKI